MDLYRRGFDSMMGNVDSFLSYTLIPVGAFCVLLFCWNLWLAPYKILINAGGAPGTNSHPKANAAWAKVPVYSLWQAAALWHDLEPNSQSDSGPSYASFRRLKHALEAGQIKAYRLHRPDLVDRYAEVTKEELVAFAKKHGEKPPFLFT